MTGGDEALVATVHERVGSPVWVKVSLGDL